MREIIRRFAREESGQDVIEYGLLAAFLGIAGWATWDFIADSMGGTYISWDTAVQSLWEPPEPGAGS